MSDPDGVKDRVTAMDFKKYFTVEYVKKLGLKFYI